MKTRKDCSIPKPFIAMTDMLVSLNAGLLVLGILSAVDPKHESDWRRLQQEAVQIEREAGELQRRTLTLRQRHQTLVRETKRNSSPPGTDDSEKRHALVLSEQKPAPATEPQSLNH
jgi:hypothetical protein